MIRTIAHRGFSAKYPENTMLAFRKAVEAGCDGIEMDVHLTADGGLAVIHDENVKRTTNGSGLVKDMTMEQLRQLDAGQGEKIPTLEEYFDYVSQYPILNNIELKNSIFWYEGMEQKIIDLVRERNLEDRVLFSSFNHYSILECKRIAPEIRCGFLFESWIVQGGAYAKKHGVEWVHPEFHGLNPVVMEEIRSNGVGVNTWTLSRRRDILDMAALGVDGVITNDPAYLLAVLAETQE